MQLTYSTIYLYFINATELLYDLPLLYQCDRLTLYNLLMDLPLLFQRHCLTLRFTSTLSMQLTYSTIYLYFINATELLYDLPLLYQCDRLTLQFTSTSSTRPTYYYYTIYSWTYLYFINAMDFALRFTSNFINATELLDSSPIYFYQCDRLTLPYLPMDLPLLYQHDLLNLQLTSALWTRPTAVTYVLPLLHQHNRLTLWFISTSLNVSDLLYDLIDLIEERA